MAGKQNEEFNLNCIRTIRKTVGMTQSQLAKKSKVSRKTINRLEGGEGTITFGALSRLCSALGVKIMIAFDVDTIVQESDVKKGKVEKELFGNGLKST